MRAAVAEHRRAVAEQPRRFVCLDADVGALARRQRTKLQEAELGRLAGTLRQVDGELDLDRGGPCVLADREQLIEDLRRAGTSRA